MMLLHGVNSIVLLFALAEIHAGYATDSDARVTPSPDMRARFDMWSCHPAAEAGHLVLLSLVKDALRSVTGYVGAAPAGYRLATPAVFIGIRG